MATLKQELMIWAEALDAYDGTLPKSTALDNIDLTIFTGTAENFQLALKKFEIIAETSRIEFNLGIIRASLG